ncbi:MAG TPA: 6-O-methylguanine DNA methyltransferase [Candidatus Wildermuthbacteria bacterium]|nr:6-O-methylguanine DNA methyltransferase [Candidatus Wildermuthbacteria bacterium]
MQKRKKNLRMRTQGEFSKRRITSFEQKVYEAVKSIPRGETRTYKQIAQAIGRPNAFRAVGTALGKNPDLKKIPCHRVVRSDGKVGGYRFGEKRKRKLLLGEGAVPRED